MAKRKFVVNKYNGYSIRNHYFKPNPVGRGCTLETDDPDIIRLIENADGYAVFIHPAETPEELAAMKAAEKEGDSYATLSGDTDVGDASTDNTQPIATQGARGTMSSRAMRRGQVITPKEK